jgi:hypothetical protein
VCASTTTANAIAAAPTITITNFWSLVISTFDIRNLKLGYLNPETQDTGAQITESPRFAFRIRANHEDPQKENARGERAFSVVNLGVVGVFYYPRGDFGGLIKSRVNSVNSFVSGPGTCSNW